MSCDGDCDRVNNEEGCECECTEYSIESFWEFFLFLLLNPPFPLSFEDFFKIMGLTEVRTPTRYATMALLFLM